MDTIKLIVNDNVLNDSIKINFDEINPYIKFYIYILNLIIEYIRDSEYFNKIKDKSTTKDIPDKDKYLFDDFIYYLNRKTDTKNGSFLAKNCVLILNKYYNNKYIFKVKKHLKENTSDYLYIIIECKNILKKNEVLYICILFIKNNNPILNRSFNAYFSSDLNYIKEKIKYLIKKDLSFSSPSSSSSSLKRASKKIKI